MLGQISLIAISCSMKRSNKNFRFSYLLALFLCVPLPAFAATAVTSDITSDTLWTAGGSPYLVNFENDPYFPHLLTVAPGVTLTIDPGVIVKFAAYNGITVQGTLRALGTESNPIIFTSLQDDSVGGDTNGDGIATTPTDEQWMHLQFNTGSSGTFDYAIVRYGGAQIIPLLNTGIENFGGTLVIDHTTLTRNGYDGFGQYGGHTTMTNSFIFDQLVGISMYGGELDMSGTRIYNNATSGIDLSGEGALSITHSEIDHNGTGIVAGAHGSITVSNSSIHDNGSFGINNQSQIIGYDDNDNPYVEDPGITIDARNTWWGTGSGPYDPVGNASGTGNGVYGDVVYSPWLTSNPFTPSDPCIALDSCASNVLFIPGLKGSVLKVNNDTVWPPSFWSDDLPELALTTGGDSVNPVVVDGVLETFHGTPIYSGFTTFMDGLVASGTTTEWGSLPYDWRFSPERILADGIKTPTGTIDPIAEVERLAAHSGTGKVIIVAHSMGGMLGKALIKKLEEEGKEGLVDSFVMVGAPQLGAPQAAAALLHGDSEGILGMFIVDPAIARKIAQNFQSAYDLLPSPRYFDEVADAPIVFSPTAAFTQAWRDYWGPATDTYAKFFSFITGDGVARADPDFSQLHIPEILRTDLAEHARDFHTVYDTYAFPDSIRVVQVAGWGLPTAKAIEYKTRHFRQNYEPIFTVEGDKTVVYPSAISSIADETYFLNLATYNALENASDYEHRDLLSSSPIQQVLTSVIKNEDIFQTSYVVSVKPITDSLTDQLIVSTHSPVILGAYDAAGNFTGINPNQDLEAEVLSITEDIPGSTFTYFGDNQYLFLPKEGSYTFVFKGIGSGPTTVDIESFANDTTTTIASYSEIPVSPETNAVFIVDSTVPQNTEIEVDSNGDGATDLIVSPDLTGPSLEELIATLKTKVQSLAIKTQLKKSLVKKIDGIQAKIDKRKVKQSDILIRLTAQVTKNGDKGKIDTASLADIIQLLDELQAQSGAIPIDPNLISALRGRINNLSVSQTLKNSLLSKVGRLEKMINITRSLASLTQQITRKSAEGQITDADTQAILSLLTSIEHAL
ncbi:MAG: alpha/beta fold hydrolase [bacterium]|nr:alpha/beta fold hydrolase [bacterium]